MITKNDKLILLAEVKRALSVQFEGYSWDNMIDDALIDYSKEEIKWAKENIIYDAKIIKGGLNGTKK